MLYRTEITMATPNARPIEVPDIVEEAEYEGLPPNAGLAVRVLCFLRDFFVDSPQFQVNMMAGALVSLDFAQGRSHGWRLRVQGTCRTTGF